MLKKTGIVVAAATAGLLAVSPLAFAQVVSVDDNDIQIPIQACGNQVLNNVLGIVAKQSNKQDGDVDCDQKNSAKHHDGSSDDSDDED